jgi:hypothetical protein
MRITAVHLSPQTWTILRLHCNSVNRSSQCHSTQSWSLIPFVVHCYQHSCLLGGVLRGNTRVTILALTANQSNNNFLYLLRALAENISLTKLIARQVPIYDETWRFVCQLLANHPALELLDLYETASSH